MSKRGDNRSAEHEIEDLKASIKKYLKGDVQPTSEVISDLTKAIHDLSDLLAELGRRIENIEDTHEDWTTRGWMPPPGSDRRS